MVWVEPGWGRVPDRGPSRRLEVGSSQGSTRDGDRGLGQSEGSGEDLGLWVSRGPPAVLGPGGTWVPGKCHLALVAVLPHVLLVAVTVLTFSASLRTVGFRFGDTI